MPPDTHALQKRLVQLEERQGSVVSTAEFQDLTEKLKAHSVMDLHSKWTEAKQDMQHERDAYRQQSAVLRQMEARAAEMKQSLEEMKLKMWHMQEDHKKVKAHVEKDTGNSSSEIGVRIGNLLKTSAIFF